MSTIKTIFCSTEQKDTDHVLSFSPSGELVATCPCKSFLKFPAGLKPAELDKLVKKNKEVNQGQVTVEQMEKLLDQYSD